MGRYSNGGAANAGAEAALVSSISKLRLTQGSNAKLRSGPALPRRPVQRMSEVLEAVVLLNHGNEMLVEEPDTKQVDPTWPLQISDLLRTVTGLESIGMAPVIKLLKVCGLSGDLHHSFLKYWRDETSHVISSPVFDTSTFWSHHVLQLSLDNTALHCAILAVAGLQYIRVGEYTERRYVQSVYRLYAESERRLRFPKDEATHEVTVATQVCLLFFDYFSGNQAAWEDRLDTTMSAFKYARYTNLDSVGKYFFYPLARQEQIIRYTSTSSPSRNRDLLNWEQPMTGDMDLDDDQSGVGMDKIGALYAELLQFRSCINENAAGRMINMAAIEERITAWKERFPISLQTYRFEGDVYDKTCFLHALTCHGGGRAVALHCLFSEMMIWKTDQETFESKNTLIHEHAVTICRLAQSVPTGVGLLDAQALATLDMLLGSLYTAGLNLFSKDGKAWLDRLLRWIAGKTGNSYAENLVEGLKRQSEAAEEQHLMAAD